MKRFILVIIFSLWMAIPSSALTPYFTDTTNHWAHNYAEQLKSECNISGYLDENEQSLRIYKPDNYATRAEVVKFILQCLGVEVTTITADPFSDIEWYVAPMAEAKARGWVTGYQDGTLRPNNYITRAEALKIILITKLGENKIVGGAENFFDVAENAWYYRYVAYATLKEYISGYKDLYGKLTGYFGPDKNITRGEIAKVISKVWGWDKQETGGSTQEIPDEPTDEPTDQGGGSGGDTDTGTPGSLPMVSTNCSVFPADNPWNRDISGEPLDPNSTKYISYIGSLGGNQSLHADFGGNGEYGIPYVLVPGDQPKVPIEILWYPDESDPGPYPIPSDAPVEGGGDKHVIVVDKDNCKLYELYAAEYAGPGWKAGSAAIFDLTSNALRPNGWTSADAAGLPIFPGLARYDEVAKGEINHALRVAFQKTQAGYIHPATHYASDETNPGAPPMGLRLRLKADYDISGYSGQSLVILKALKKYGLIVADNGSNWFITGASDTRWDDEDLNQLKEIPGSAFEVVKSGEIVR